MKRVNGKGNTFEGGRGGDDNTLLLHGNLRRIDQLRYEGMMCDDFFLSPTNFNNDDWDQMTQEEEALAFTAAQSSRN